MNVFGFQIFILILFIKQSTSLPNFVFILTDDEDLLLNGLLSMRSAQKYIADKGKVFRNAFVNSPICCPSRSTILSGKYPHNNGVRNNSISGNCSSIQWQKDQEPNSFVSLLKARRNYKTFFAGKYLNQYGLPEVGGLTHIPEGYDWWLGLKGNSKYYDYTLSVNGSERHFQNEYLTDVLSDYSMEFLNQKFVQDEPFFMMITPPAPHAPFIPAPRHKDEFPGVKAVRNPAFNATPINKHWIVQMPPDHLPTNVDILDSIQRRRLQTLLSVDEMINRIIKKLEDLNQINNTYIILSSDNGFHIGQFTQPWDKRQPYESDIRVPFFIRGPKVPRKQLENYPISAVDIAPTILDLASIDPPEFMDGSSFKEELFKDNNKNVNKMQNINRQIFLEYWGEGGSEFNVDPNCPWKFDKNVSECSTLQWCKCQDSRNNTYSCIIAFNNSQNIKICRFQERSDFFEVYDLQTDPFELNNLQSSFNKSALKNIKNEIERMGKCVGKECQDFKKEIFNFLY